jgi:hypothetical protein
MYEIKSGKEILDEFFDNVEKIPGVDSTIAAALKKLYQDNKLTNTNLSNALLKLREDAGNDKD